MSDIFANRAIVWMAAAAATLGLLFARRFLRIGEPADQTVSIGAVYATFGVIYAVILGQVLVGSWERYEETNAAVVREGDAVDGIVQISRAIPGEDGDRIEAAALAYGRAVVSDEFPSISRGNGPSASAEASLNEMYTFAGQMGIGPNAQDPMLAALISELVDLDDARGERLIGAQRDLPRVMWWTLVAGGIIAVSFIYLFAIQRGWIHFVLVLFLAVTIGLLLSLIQSFNHPFSGPMAINPSQYEARFADEAGDPT